MSYKYFDVNLELTCITCRIKTKGSALNAHNHLNYTCFEILFVIRHQNCGVLQLEVYRTFSIIKKDWPP